MENQISTLSGKLVDLQEKYLDMHEKTTKEISSLNSVVQELLDNAGLVRFGAEAPAQPRHLPPKKTSHRGGGNLEQAATAGAEDTKAADRGNARHFCCNINSPWFGSDSQLIMCGCDTKLCIIDIRENRQFNE